FGEWFIGAQRDEPLRWVTEAHIDVAVLPEVFTRQCFDRFGRGFDCDINIEPRCEFGDDAGVTRTRVGLFPSTDFLFADVKFQLPAPHAGPFVGLDRYRRESVPAELETHLCDVAPSRWKIGGGLVRALVRLVWRRIGFGYQRPPGRTVFVDAAARQHQPIDGNFVVVAEPAGEPDVADGLAVIHG